MGRQAVEGLVGYHLNLLTAVLAIGDHLPKESAENARPPKRSRRSARRLRLLPRDGNAATDDRLRPAGFTSRAGGLAARPRHGQLLQISRAFVDGKPVGNLTRDNIVDNITLYWLTGTAASAARSYWEDARALARRLRAASLLRRSRFRSASPPSPASSGLPAQLGRGSLPRSCLLQRGRPKGGHFAAWEEPELFSAELRAAFKSLR
jgi:pimeloyl-ACP methyl ester carboxylesterase